MYGYPELPLLFIQEVETFIGRNPINPVEQFRFLPELIQILPDLDKHFLRQIIGIFMVNDHLPYVPIDTFLVGPCQQVEAVLTRFRLFNFCYYELIVQDFSVGMAL